MMKLGEIDKNGNIALKSGAFGFGVVSSNSAELAQRQLAEQVGGYGMLVLDKPTCFFPEAPYGQPESTQTRKNQLLLLCQN